MAINPTHPNSRINPQDSDLSEAAAERAARRSDAVTEAFLAHDDSDRLRSFEERKAAKQRLLKDNGK